MIIKFLKNGKYSIHPARGPVVVCKVTPEGEGVNIKDAHGQVLVEAGWAEEIEAVKIPVEDDDSDPDPGTDDDANEDADNVLILPWEQEGWDAEADDAKDILAAFALEHLGLKVKKNKLAVNIIKDIQEELS